MKPELARLLEGAADREAFRADPTGWLAARGIEVRGDRRIVVHENNADELHVVLPAADSELSEADLALIAGGDGWDSPVPGLAACQKKLRAEYPKEDSTELEMQHNYLESGSD